MHVLWKAWLQGSTQTFPAGEYIIREGEPGSTFHVIVKGSAAVRKLGCCDLIGRVFLPIATSDALGNFSTLLVLLNMVLMCMPYEGMPQDYEDRLESAATLISWIFIVEMAIKLLGMGCAEY